MRKSRLLGAVCACVFSFISMSANAVLVERLGGLAYYDTDADLTWLADANYAMTSGYDADGWMNWWDANTWAAGLDIDGITGWRLPDTLQPDASCGIQDGESRGFNCTGSDMGNLFYNVLGNTAGSIITNKGPFSNVTTHSYWSATERVHDIDKAWYFELGGGDQDTNEKVNFMLAWAVQSGDVGAVPIPPALWLFGSGLLGLIGAARRKAS